MRTEEDLKNVPKLRWKYDVDGTVIAKAAGKKRKRDHLYFHGPGILGIYYERDTPLATTMARKDYMRAMWVLSEQRGDLDGTIQFICERPEDIPAPFFRSRRGYASSKTPYQVPAEP
jgi:hypothetical protein